MLFTVGMNLEQGWGNILKSERGNFLLQALLALTLVFAFIPFFARRLATRDIGAQMYATTRQVETARTAAKIYVQENADALPYETTVLSGDKFSDILEPYGLPLGFVPRTVFGQDIALIINKTTDGVSAFLRLSGGNIGNFQRAELAHRIGFFASYDSDVPGGIVDIGVQLTDMYSDVVRRNERFSDLNGFLTDLDMGGYGFDNVGGIFAHRAAFDTGEITTLTISGNEAGRKERNNITTINSGKVIFQSRAGESALSITRGTLHANSVSGRTIAKFGDAGNITVVNAAVDSFDLSAGRTGFSGPARWDVRGNVVTSRISFLVERLDVNSFLNVTRGQDVFIDEDTLSYSSATGIDTDRIITSHITLRDQTAAGLARGAGGATILDIRPAGTSILPDALVDGINNGGFMILANPTSDDDKTIGCQAIISELGGVYNQKSLAQYIICQYVFWQRLEHRIDVKACIDGGKSDCK